MYCAPSTSTCINAKTLLPQSCMWLPQSQHSGLKAPLFSGEEVMDLRNMILAMVDEPLVLVVKLADRLHNMRTVYALKPDRQRAVAAETMQVWCSLAERLGMFSLKVSSATGSAARLLMSFAEEYCDTSWEIPQARDPSCIC